MKREKTSNRMAQEATGSKSKENCMSMANRNNSKDMVSKMKFAVYFQSPKKREP